jgi:heterodisulfide reductase subunit D
MQGTKIRNGLNFMIGISGNARFQRFDALPVFLEFGRETRYLLDLIKIPPMNVPTVAELFASGKTPEVLFWVGCAGSFDQRAQRITRAFASIMQRIGIDFAILGKEEMCTGDPVRRAGNEFLFQMMAYQNIQVLNNYKISKIVTACPHCFNILKNEYPALGGNYEVIHHTAFLQSLIDEGKITMKEGGTFKGQRITYHDSCYLGRANGIYEAPRKVLEALDGELVEMKRCRSKGLCCGAGGAQMFKEEEKGTTRVNFERTNEALSLSPSVIAAACPFCNTMLTDGVKNAEKEGSVKVMDIAELVEASMK